MTEYMFSEFPLIHKHRLTFNTCELQDSLVKFPCEFSVLCLDRLGTAARCGSLHVGGGSGGGYT